MPNSLFPYPGNKARHSEWIVQYIPEHKCYVEVFGGAAGVLFNKPRSTVEVYNDLDGDIVHFFEILRNRNEELQEWLKAVPFSRELHEKWSAAYYDGQRPVDDIERAGRYFYLRYSQFGGKVYGSSGFCTKASRSHAGGFVDKVDALETFSERLRRVAIENMDWSELIDQYDTDETVFYLDPPYDGTEYNYRADGFDHRGLHQKVCDTEARCIISYDSIPRWYGDEFIVVSKDSAHKVDNSNGSKESTEYLLMNFDTDGESLMSGVGQQGLEAFTDGGNARNSE